MALVADSSAITGVTVSRVHNLVMTLFCPALLCHQLLHILLLARLLARLLATAISLLRHFAK